jgi:hypothetical protein
MLKLVGIIVGSAAALVLVIAVVAISTSEPPKVVTASPSVAEQAASPQAGPVAEGERGRVSVHGATGVVEVTLPPKEQLLESMALRLELRRVMDRMRDLLTDPAYQTAVLFQVHTEIEVLDSYGAKQVRPGITASIKRAELAKFQWQDATPEAFERFARATGSIQINPALTKAAAD